MARLRNVADGPGPGLQALAVIAVCIGFSVGLNQLHTQTKVVHQFPDDHKLPETIGTWNRIWQASLPIETVVRFDEQSQKDTSFLERMELVRNIQERMRAHPEISGSTSLASLQPVTEPLPEEAGFLQKSRRNKHAITIHQQIRDGEIPGARSYYMIAESSHQTTGPGDRRLHENGDELWRIATQVNVMNDNDFARTLADLHQISQDVLRLQPGSQHLIAGTVPIVVRTQQAVFQSLVSSVCLALALIFAVLAVMQRSILAGMIAMIPAIVPVAVVFGMISWMQQRIDIGTMVTASIGLGIAIEGAMHLLAGFRRSMHYGKSRRDAVIEALVQNGPAMWQASAAMTITLMTLLPAELLSIGRFGALMASMVGVAFVSNLVLLPQLLGSSLGRFCEPCVRTIEAPIIAAEPEVNEVAPVTESVSHGTLAPSPHIKPLDSTRKKRRPTA